MVVGLHFFFKRGADLERKINVNKMEGKGKESKLLKLLKICSLSLKHVCVKILNEWVLVSACDCE